MLWELIAQNSAGGRERTRKELVERSEETRCIQVTISLNEYAVQIGTDRT